VASALQLGGAALVAGALVFVYALIQISRRPVVGQAISPDVAAALLVAATLLALGMPALYAVQAAKTGILGLAAHALLAVGLALPVVVAAGPLLHASADLATGEHPIVFVLGIALALGLLLTGVATLGADVLPRLAAVLLLAAMAGFVFVFFVAEFLPPPAGQVGTAVFGALLMTSRGWLGVAIWQRPG
jgi:hypothetical protein